MATPTERGVPCFLKEVFTTINEKFNDVREKIEHNLQLHKTAATERSISGRVPALDQIKRKQAIRINEILKVMETIQTNNSPHTSLYLSEKSVKYKRKVGRGSTLIRTSGKYSAWKRVCRMWCARMLEYSVTRKIAKLYENATGQPTATTRPAVTFQNLPKVTLSKVYGVAWSENNFLNSSVNSSHFIHGKYVASLIWWKEQSE